MSGVTSIAALPDARPCRYPPPRSAWSRRPVRGEAGLQVAARYGVHRARVYKFKAPYEAEGDNALEPAHASALARAGQEKVEGS
jgi:hypothetical protein